MRPVRGIRYELPDERISASARTLRNARPARQSPQTAIPNRAENTDTTAVIFRSASRSVSRPSLWHTGNPTKTERLKGSVTKLSMARGEWRWPSQAILMHFLHSYSDNGDI